MNLFKSRQKIQNAMILGAGLGTRMRHLTEDRPKPMVDLAGKPMIGHVLDRLADNNIPNAFINVHYKAEVLEEYLASREKPEIFISDERDEILNTGGGVAGTIRNFPQLGESPFLLHNSDSVWLEDTQNNIQTLIDAWQPDKMDCLMLLAPCSTSLGYVGNGDFHMEEDGRLNRQSGDKPAEFVFAGVSIQNPKIFEGCPAGSFSINMQWNEVLRNGRMYGVRHQGTWMHVGDPETLQEAELCLAQKQKTSC